MATPRIRLDRDVAKLAEKARHLNKRTLPAEINFVAKRYYEAFGLSPNVKSAERAKTSP